MVTLEHINFIEIFERPPTVKSLDDLTYKSPHEHLGPLIVHLHECKLGLQGFKMSIFKLTWISSSVSCKSSQTAPMLVTYA